MKNQYGNLKFISAKKGRGSGVKTGVFLCTCGESIALPIWRVKRGLVRDCGCLESFDYSKGRAGSYLLTAQGETKSISLWSRVSAVSESTIRRRVKNGWTHHDAIFMQQIKRGRKNNWRKELVA